MCAALQRHASTLSAVGGGRRPGQVTAEPCGLGASFRRRRVQRPDLAADTPADDAAELGHSVLRDRQPERRHPWVTDAVVHRGIQYLAQEMDLDRTAGFD